MFPDERSLVSEYRDKSFTLLGVNNDDQAERVRAAVRSGRITWRSWWAPGDREGSIPDRWAVRPWPALYLIDRDGVIRFKRIAQPVDFQEVRRAIDQLLQEDSGTAPSTAVD